MNKENRTFGIVKEIIDERTFIISLGKEVDITATLSTKSKRYLSYEISKGEKVPIELSPYDDSKGIIIVRSWKREL